jgi:hypothetical protein
MKKVKRKPAKKARIERTGDAPIPPTRKGDLPVMNYDISTEAGLKLLKDELNRIPRGFGSAVLFNCGTFRQTLAVIDKAKKGTTHFRFGKDVWNGQGVFKGITVHRYKTA